MTILPFTTPAPVSKGGSDSGRRLVARRVGIVSASRHVICSCSSRADGSGTDAYRYSTGYGSAAIVTTTIHANTGNATAIDTTAVDATARDGDASSIGEGVS